MTSMVLLFIFTYLAAAPPWARADIPRYINYQGKLTDADDNPITADVSITVRIYDAASGGTALWEEVQSVTVTRGIFSILLGNTEDLDDLGFNEAYWYSVEVESDGEMTPRQRLTAVAYAINADKLDGHDASDFLTVDSSEGTTTGITVSGGLITAGANEDIELNPTGTGEVIITIDSTSGDFRITDGTTDFVLVDNETGNVTIANDLTVSNITATGTSDLRGNISNSIADGAVTIADALTVTGQTTISGALDLNSNLDLDYSGVSAALDVNQSSTGAAAKITGGPVIIGAETDDEDIDHIDSAGEVYIKSNLEVDGTIYGTIASTGGDSTFSSLVVTGASDLQGNLDVGGNADITGNLDVTGDLGITGTSDLQGNVSDSGGVFTVADNVDITADALTSGGTDDYALNIAQTLNDTGDPGGSDEYRAIKVNVTGTETGITGWDNVYLMDLQTNDTSKFNVDNSGNVTAAGTVTVATATAPMHATTKTYVDTRTWATAGGWTENLLNADVYVTDTADNVGIGTTAPGAYKLDVAGATNTTSLYIGGTQVTATAAELNIMDGVTATTAEINLIHGYTGSTANLNTLTNASNADALHTHAATGNETVTSNLTFTIDSDNAGASVADGAGLVLDGGTGTDVSLLYSTDSGDLDVAGITGGLDIPSDTLYKVDGTQIALADLSDGANVAHTDAAETISKDWVNTAFPWADGEVANDLTISGGTINNTAIGGTSAEAGTFTTLTAGADVDIDFATAGEQITIDSTNVDTAGLIVINDFRDATNNALVGEATISVDADGAYALYIEDGDTLIGDDQVLVFGDGRDVSISYDETSTDRLIIDGKYGGAFHNLVWNGDFESWGQDTEDIAPDAWTEGTGARADRDTSPKINTYVAKVTSDATGGRILSQEISARDLKASTTYAISVWAKATDGDTAKLDIAGEDGDSFTAQTTTATTWTLLSGTFATDATPAAITIQLIANAANDIVWFDGAMIQEGKMISQFAPRYIHDTGDQSIYGDLTLYNTTIGAEGTLTVEGTIDITGTQSLDGQQVIDIDSDEAFLVRKDGDAGDVLLVDTNARNVEIGEDAASKDAYLIIHGTDTAGLEVRAGDTSTDAVKIYHDDANGTLESAVGNLKLTGATGIDLAGATEDITLSATTATNGGITLSGPSATIDLGAAADGALDVDATTITIDKTDAGTLDLRSGTTSYFALDAVEALTVGDDATATTIDGLTLALSSAGDVDITGDVEIDTTGGLELAFDLPSEETGIGASLAIATDPTKAGAGGGADSDGAIKIGINEGMYQYIWYDADGGSDANGAFRFSDQAVIPSASPATLNFSMPDGALYAIMMDDDPDNNVATDIQTFSVVSIPVPGPTWQDTKLTLFDVSTDGSFNIYDPSVGEAVFQIEAGGALAHDFRNLIKNGSFEAFSGFEDFIAYDTIYSETVYTEANFAAYGMKGGWDNFAPDEWGWVAGGVSQHSPELFKTGGGGVFTTDFYDGKSSVALYEKSNIGTPYTVGSIEPSTPLDAAVKQVVKGLEPDTWYSIGAALMAYGTNTTAIIDIAGDYRPTIDLTAPINTTGALSSISVSSTADFPAGGTIKIGSELLSYTGKTDTGLTGITRGVGLTEADTHTITGADLVQLVFKRLTSTSESFECKRGSFKTDSTGTDITIYLICQQTTGADEFDLARFDAVQMVKGKTVPKYAPTSIVDTGDQSIYGTLHLGRSASGQGGILAVDQFIRTRGIDFFDDDPGISGTAGGGGYVGPYYELINTTDGTILSSESPGNVMMITSGNYVKPNNRKFQVWVTGSYDYPSGNIKYRYAECTDPMADTYGSFVTWIGPITIPVDANTDVALEFGVTVKFSEGWDDTEFKGGDRWEFKTYGGAQEEDMYGSFARTSSYIPSSARIFKDPETGALTFEDEKAGKVKLSEIISQGSAGYISPPVRDPANQSTTNITATGDLNSGIISSGKTFVVDVEWSESAPTKFGWRTKYDYYDDTSATYEHFGNWGVTITKGVAQALDDATAGNIGISITFPTDCTLYNYDRWTFYAAPPSASNLAAHGHSSAADGGDFNAPGTLQDSFAIGKNTDATITDVILNFGSDPASKYIKWSYDPGAGDDPRFDIAGNVNITGTLSATNLGGIASEVHTHDGSAIVSGTVDALYLPKADLTEAGTTSVLTITGGTDAVIGSSGTTIEVKKASTIQSGYLSSGDWNDFNNKASSPWTAGVSDVYYTAGNIGIGTSAPTSLLHLGAGTAALAPFKLTSGTNLTNPAAGAMEYDGSNLYFTPSASRKTIAFTDSNITGTASNVTDTVAVANGGTGAISFSVSELVRMNAGNTALESSGKTISDFSASDHDHSGTYLELAGGTMAGSIGMGDTYKITGLATPTDAADAATMAYVDSKVVGLSWKEAVLVLITDNTALPLDETTGNRYLLSTTGGVPHANWDEAEAGDMVQFNGTLWVEEDPQDGDAVFVEDVNTGYVYTGTAWSAFTGATAYTWGTGLSVNTGTAPVTIDVNLLSSDLAVDGNGDIYVKDSGIDHNSLANSHNLTTDIDHDALTNFAANEHIDWTNASSALVTSGSIQTGVNTADGALKIYSEQGETDYILTLAPNDAMTASTTIKLPAAAASGESFLKMGTDGVIDYDTSAYLTAEVDGDTTNELNSSMGWVDGTNTISVTDAGGAKSVVITGFLESEVDGSVTNEINTITADDTNITSGIAITLAGGTNATTAVSGDIVTINVDDAFITNNADDVMAGTLTIQTTTPSDLIIDNSTTGSTADSGYITLSGNYFNDPNNVDVDMNMFLDITTNADYKLSIMDTAKNAEIASLDESGNLQIDGDLTIGTTGLSETNQNDAGAYKIGVYAAELSATSAANVQDVLDDLDAAIVAAGANQNLWATISSQSDSTTADAETDTLTINGAGIASTAIVGDTLTITATEADTLAAVATRGATFTGGVTLATSGGNVGIGTTGPGEELHVIGQIRVADSTANDVDGYIYLGRDTVDVEGTSTPTSHYLMWDDDWPGKDGDGNPVTGWLKTDEGMSVKHLEVRGASPAAITFGSGDTAKRLQFDSISQEFSFTGGKLKQSFQNLIRNGSFEGRNPTGWYSFNDGINFLDNTYKKFGLKSLRINDDNASAEEGATFYLPDSDRFRDKRLTLSFWAKASTAAVGSVGFSDYNTDTTADDGEVSNILLDTAWREFIISYPTIATENIASDADQLVVYIFGAAGDASTSGSAGDINTGGNVATDTQTGGYIYIDGATLVEGNLSLDYSPSPIFDTGDQILYGDLAIGANANAYTDEGVPRLIFGEPPSDFGDGYYGSYGMGTGEIALKSWYGGARFQFNRGIHLHDNPGLVDAWGTTLTVGGGSNGMYSCKKGDTFMSGRLELRGYPPINGGIYDSPQTTLVIGHDGGGSIEPSNINNATGQGDVYVIGKIESDGGFYGDGSNLTGINTAVSLNSDGAIVNDSGLKINLAESSGLAITSNQLALDSTYSTGSAYDSRFINATSDTMTGKLIINENLTTTGAQALDINSTGIMAGTANKTIASISDAAVHTTTGTITGLEVDFSGGTYTNATARGIDIQMKATTDSALNTNAKIVAGSATLGSVTVTGNTIAGATKLNVADAGTFTFRDNTGQTIMQLDETTRTAQIYNLTVNGTQTVIDSTTTNVDHLNLDPGAIDQVAILVEPPSGIGTLTADLVQMKNVNGGANVFVIDRDGNITTVGTVDGVDVSALKTAADLDYDDITDLPTAAVTNGATSTIATGDQIYDFVIDEGYSTASDPLTGLVQSTTSGTSYITGGKFGIGITSLTADLNVKGNLTTALTGTVSVTIDTAAVTGTNFDPEIAVGDAIKIGDEIFTVSARASDTSLTLDSNHTAGASGVTAYKDSDLFKVLDGNDVAVFTLDKSGDLTMEGTINATVTGTSSNANLLDNIDSSQFLRSDVNDAVTTGVILNIDTGATLSIDGNWDIGGTPITPTAAEINILGGGLSAAELDSDLLTSTEGDTAYVAVGGDTMTGNLIMTSADVSVDAGQKLNVEGSAGDTYMSFNSTTSRIEFYADGELVAYIKN